MVKYRWTRGHLIVASLLFTAGTLSADAVAESRSEVTTFDLPDDAAERIDYRAARPRPLPSIDGPRRSSRSALAARPSYPGEPGVSGGARSGSGELTMSILAPRTVLRSGVSPDAFGSSQQPFTTSRVDLRSPPNKVSRYYPFRAAGKLFFKDGGVSYVCSGSLIKKGVVVTAAHCVADFGKKKYYSAFRFVPAYYNGEAPYGEWRAAKARVLTAYFNGTDSCEVDGVVCRDDVAVLTLRPQDGDYPGTRTGWFNYGWNGYGFNEDSQALVSQLGYPVSHDSGQLMQRSDSQGFVDAASSDNTVWGSRQTGGSSGGPELVNLGVPAKLDGTGLGREARFNTVVGVTSWGYTNPEVKQQGASPFLSTNIKALVDAACAETPAACAD